MEMVGQVQFRNVGQSYFPETRVDCHYTLSSQHSWASSDWIGLFKVGWSSVKDYHTFVWALAPADYEEGTQVNCCVQFQASYLPKPGCQEYEFVYVDAKGGVSCRSSKFTFCFPKPLEELVTLEEEQQEGEEGATGMLLVVPRAELLQSRLQECLRERAELLQLQEATTRQKEKERSEFRRAREAYDRGNRELRSDISRLQEELRKSQERVEEMERMQKEDQAFGEQLCQEKGDLLIATEESRSRIKALEEDIETLNHMSVKQEAELERVKERARRAGALRKDEEEERKNVQAKLEQTETELRSLSKEFQGLRSSLAQRDTSVLQLHSTISTLTQKLTTAHRKEAEGEATLKEMRSLRERLSNSDRAVDALKSNMTSMVTQRDQVHSELHQARLQVAQLTLQLADCSLALREGRARWAQEKHALLQDTEKDREQLEKVAEELQRVEEELQEEKIERVKVEVELGREKDCNRVQLCETRRELQELKASLRVAQKEKEQLLMEKQELMECVCQLEHKIRGTPGAKQSGAAIVPTASPLDSEDEDPEALQPVRPLRHLGGYSLCEQGEAEASLMATPPSPSMGAGLLRAVVINQPAPLTSPHQAGADPLVHSSDSEDNSDPLQCGRHSTAEETALLLPEQPVLVLSDLADTSMW